jgi:uncharacterized protein YkwD
LQKVAVALLAAPVILLVYLGLIPRRSVAARVGLVLGVGALLGMAGFAAVAPDETSAAPAGAQPTVLTNAEFQTTIRTGQGLRAPVVLDFTSPMDMASVAAALRVEPTTALGLSWNAAGTQLTVHPAATWAAGTYHVLTVGATARDAAGGRLAGPARAAFLTRNAAAVRYAAAPLVGDHLAARATFSVVVDGEVDPAVLAKAVTIEPAVQGRVVVTRETEATTAAASATYRATFVPRSMLAPDTQYKVAVAAGLRDLEGVPVAAAEPLVIRTAIAPTVVRFRPFGAASGIPVDQDVSVRFTEAMDPVATSAAFRVTVGGKAVPGAVRWAEGNTVLVLDPTTDFAKSARVTLAVTEDARSAAGVPIATPIAVSFTVVAPPPPPRPRPAAQAPRTTTTTTTPRTTPTTTPAPAAVASWAQAEQLVVSLMNCTRGGGWVEASGSCSSPGGGSLAPLAYDAGIAANVARPYAKRLVAANVCSHFHGGGPDDRLRAAGYTSYQWAENLTCRYYSDLRAAAIGAVRFFQSEKAANGGHWRNMMSPKFDRVGVGLWVSGGRLRIVMDFYRP